MIRARRHISRGLRLATHLVGTIALSLAHAAHAQDDPDLAATLDPALRALELSPATGDSQSKLDRFVAGTVDPEFSLDLVMGRPRILVFRETPKRVQLPDETVARFELISDTELSVTGLATGTTQLNIWFDDPTAPSGQQVIAYLVRVMPDPEARARLDRVFQSLRDEIDAIFPTADITLRLVGESLIIEGQARDSREVDEIIQVIEANAPKIEAQVPFQLDAQGNPAVASAETFSLTGERRTGTATRLRIINRIVVPGPQQVALRVTVAEVNRAAARSVGMNFTYDDEGGDISFGQLTGGLLAPGGESFVNLPISLDNGQIRIAINALRGLSFAKSLAEPTLVAMNGQTASFLAGGEFPVPVVTGATSDGLQGVDFIPFGVELAFTPYIEDRDRIRLVVSAEVSTRNTSTGTTIAGASVSGRDTRTFETVVELREGQTLAVAGLIQQSLGGASDRVPALGDLPFVGMFFGNNRNSSSEQELVILVSPQLVEPLDPAELPQYLPGDDIFEPSDIEFFIFSKLESRVRQDFRSSVATDYERQATMRSANQQFILGPFGHSDGR